MATTCLAETIGEDLPRMIQDFYISHPEHDVKIIPVSSCGYSGTQYEGFFAALRAILQYTDMETEKHDKINIITGMISPADTRYLKDLLTQLGTDYILFPDLSENLDGSYQSVYERLPQGGTSLSDISKMAGSRLTIELSTLNSEAYSPGKYLNETYGVPLVRCNMPVGLRDTDTFIELLLEKDRTLPAEVLKERGRYLDAMVDSHKYNGEGRAVVFGEPDFVYSMVRLCLENGITPVVTATGAKCDALESSLRDQIHQVSDGLFVDDFVIADSCDFDHIEAYASKYNANLMIGSSDGRRIEEKMGIPLIRCAFPIHDHVGGQRIRTFGYEGSMILLDRITNTILSKKEHSFRSQLYNKYYKADSTPDKEQKTAESSRGYQNPAARHQKNDQDSESTTSEKTKTHPCFSGCASGAARIHLPVAKKCNIQCNYCLRKFDCPNESRPGVTTRVLSPEEALEKYLIAKKSVPNLKVVGIAGPGDALADFELTEKTLRLIREQDPDITFCISTNGLMLPLYVKEFSRLGITHVTVTVNALDPAIGNLIYKTVTYMGTTYRGEAAAAILLANQLSGLRMLQELGIVCKVNIVMLKGINEAHIPEVVNKVKELGCFITNIMQMIPVAGSAFEHMPLTSNKEIVEMRKKCGQLLNQMYHCKQCRADAVGTLEHDLSLEFDKMTAPRLETNQIMQLESSQQPQSLINAAGLPALRFAVASKGGILVDQHFGHVSDLYVYEYHLGEFRFVERRSVTKYCSGSENCGDKVRKDKTIQEDEMQAGKLEKIFDTISDCSCVIAMRIGESPKQKLAEKGIVSMMYYGKIEDAVTKAASILMDKNKKLELIKKGSVLNGYRKEAIS